MKEDTKEVLSKIIAADDLQNQLLRIQNERLNEIEDSLQGLTGTLEIVVEILELITTYIEKQSTVQKQIVDFPMVRPQSPTLKEFPNSGTVTVGDLPGYYTVNYPDLTDAVFPITDEEWDDGPKESTGSNA